ncbi:DUF6390 family protein [Actinokineospora sp.]|uniref:DUF6390 family protein n=1 Tax=Actinokineospora sp. TaxID=1872133 RepID=UPI004037FDA0
MGSLAVGHSGAELFFRYAYPPNSLGFCGPADSDELLSFRAAGADDRGLVRLVRGFSGAWPYLELIAGATGIRDPLDHRVVEAYWLGNRLLDAIDVPAIANSMEERFKPSTGKQFPHLVASVLAGGVPHHSFQVFCVYPWLRLLGDDKAGAHALTVLDRCRIRWGRVVSVHGDRVLVRSRALRADGRLLSFAEPAVESVRPAEFHTALSTGDWVSLHWDWICDRLTARQLGFLRRYTVRQLDIVNHRVAHPGTAAVLA